MKVTKYTHSCFTLEKNNEVLVIDPGAWSTDFVVPDGVVAVVVTHEHADHFDISQLTAIINANPRAIIYAPSAVTEQVHELPVQPVAPNDTVRVGGFSLTFVGGVHATIHADFHPEFANIGVIVDDTLYHPGDSLFIPSQPVKILSVPIIAPWEKVSESMDFMTHIKPEVAFPTHDGMLSDRGIELYDRWHKLAAEKHGITYERIAGSIEI